MGKTYIRFIGYLQTIAIILVVLGHSLHEFPDGDHGRSLAVYRMIYSFHMPLFIFISGFLMAYTADTALQNGRRGYRKFVVSKIKRLMVPYLVLTAVTFVPRTFMSSFADDEMTLSAESFIKAFVMPEYLPIPYFWFLQTAFTLLIAVFTITCALSRLKAGRTISDLVLVALAVVLTAVTIPANVFSTGMSARMCLFFVAGIVYCHRCRQTDDAVPWCSPLFLTCMAVMWAVTFFLFENTPWFFVCALAGIAMTVSLAKIIDSRNLTFLDHLTGANYMIFLLSWYFNVAFQQILAHYVALPWYVHTALSLAAGIYIPLLFYRLMLRHPDNRAVRAASFILGHKAPPTDNEHKRNKNH